MPDLKTDYIDPEWEGERGYIKTTNTDNTVSFTDVTAYINSGDYIGANDINTTNAAVNAFANTYKSWIGGSFTPLKTDYADGTWDGKKKFREIDNGDDTYSFVDVTQYDTTGTNYAAADINTANTLINSLTDGYDTGIASIAARLRALGVTNISDLVGAIDTMVSVQTTNGTEQGKTDVIDNPNSYGLYTKSQYDTVANNNTAVRNSLRAIASNLVEEYNDFKNYDEYGMDKATVNQAVDDYCKKEMSSSQASSARSAINGKVQSRLNVETGFLTNIANDATRYKNQLNQLL